MKQIKCPNCGANISVSDDRDLFFCEYCGAKIDKSGGKITFEVINRIVDEAKIKEVELERQKLKETNPVNTLKNLLIWCGVGVVIVLLLMRIFQ